ncbi:unnamed protein product [Cylicocyclus nassatus]|uniref:Nose resistant-to-fluoxetine protein N-terminal domain-containing protein n=1 Tax=Cylicocyclus nassatus TaxID=53992 RepID=A0AA36GPE4_CYLNA|nr:unnamed protein product [Cylicocyclus nassatus]
MSIRSFLILVLFFKDARQNPFEAPPIPYPFDPGFLNDTELTRACLLDLTAFYAGLTTFTTTFVACRQQNGSACTPAQQKQLDDNIFAIQQLDAFGKIPPGLLELTIMNSGSYRECMEVKAPYEVQYCYVNAAVTNMSQFTDIEINMPATGNANIGPKVAVCMPESCTKKDIANFLNAANAQQLIPLQFTGTSCVPKSNTYPVAFWIYMAFLAFFISWAIVATGVDYVWQNHYKEKEQNKAVRVLLTYSIYSNGSILMDVRPPKKGTLKSLASIRFISMSWVAVGHVLMQEAFNDRLQITMNVWDPPLSNTITNGVLSVDTFFTLSGLLVAYIFFKSKPSIKFIKNPMLWIMFYVHRWLRLTPPIMMFIGFYVIMDPFVHGPWAQSKVDLIDQGPEVCKKYFWRNLLYINNFFAPEENCYAVTWYLAVDTQLYFVAPVFLIVFVISQFAGFLLVVACIAGSVGYVYAITIQKSLPGAMGIPQANAMMDFFTLHYEKPWTRCTPFLIGFLTGYVLALGKKPKLIKRLVIPIWLLATAVALACVYGSHRYLTGDDDWNVIVRATYNNFSRIGWALAVCWVIAANHWEWGGMIAKFMDHPAWQPLGKLSYCGYITHYFIARYIHDLDDRPTHFTSLWRMYIYVLIPNVVVSYVFSFFWSCLFEIPVVKLEKMLTDGLVPRKPATVKPVEEGTSKGGVDLTTAEPVTKKKGSDSGAAALPEKKAANNLMNKSHLRDFQAQGRIPSTCRTLSRSSVSK